MSIKAVSWALEQPIGGNAKLVLIALADSHSDDRGCFPSKATICRKAYISTNTYERVIVQLENLGCLTREPRYNERGGRASNEYVLHMGAAVAVGEGDSPIAGEGDSPTVTPGDSPTVGGSITLNGKGNSKVNDHGDFAIAFWPNYPFKKNKAQAEKAFKRLSPAKQQAAIDGLKTFQFRQDAQLHASTYLNNSRWEDEPTRKSNGTHQYNGSGRKLSAVARVIAAGQKDIDGEFVGEDGFDLRPFMDK